MNLGRLAGSAALTIILAAPLLATSAQESSSAAYFKRGVALYAEGKYKDAVEAFKETIKLNPNDADAFLQLGNSYRESEQFSEAIAAYAHALKLKPKWPDALYALGVAYGMSGAPKEAATYLRQSIDLKADNPKAHYNLGVAYFDLGQTAEAAASFKEAGRLNPKEPDYLFNLGTAYEKLGQLKEAEDAYAHVLELTPNNSRARYQLVLVYLAMGNRGFATIHYIALQKSDPELAKQIEDKVLGEDKPSSLIDRRVTFSIPANWELQQREDTKKVGRLQMLIPYPAADKTPHSANAAIVANPVPGKITVKEVGDSIYQNRYEGMAVVSDTPDGKWRTIVWTARNKVPYVSLDRFGVVNGVAVEFIVAFPLLENGDPRWVEKTVADFNGVCQSLKIDGANSFDAKVYLDKLPATKNKN